MRKLSAFLSAFLFTVFLFVQSAYAQNLQAPTIAAKSWLLVDLGSGQVITSSAPHERIEPESLTKLMTAYLTFNAVRDGKLSLSDSVRVSDAASKMSGGGFRMFLSPKKAVTVRELILGLLVQSGNDAAIALAEAVSGTEAQFVALMNQEAARMGMTQTKFSSPHGHPSTENFSTAYDLSLLAAHLIADHADYYHFFSTKSFEYSAIRHTNRNRLLWLDPAVDGLITARSERSAYSLIASAKRPARAGNRRLLSIVLGAGSDQLRTQESLKLLNWGFQHFETVKIYSRAQVIASPEVWKGSSGNVKVGFKRDLFVTVPKGMATKMRPVLEHRDPLLAPIQDGQRVGTLKMMVDDRVLVELPVVALESVNTASVFGRAWDSLRLWTK
ncbi:MAG: D-alanyl-D-alanine carboxypeptidase [Oxalobacter sp.]|nr:MAG: D-alanyl-D-alanine carboxypeptidase [Oxalobacter sp.]